MGTRALGCAIWLLVCTASAPALDPLFEARVAYNVEGDPWSVFAIDVDGDGDLDLATANHDSDNVSILLNDGNGTFATAANFGAGNGPHELFAIDLDGDGDADLVTANDRSDDVSVLLNNGDGTMATAIHYGAGNGTAGAVGTDLDGDGDADLVTANHLSDNVSVLLNNGDGTFASAANYGAGDGTHDVFAVDLDDDGDYDVATSNNLSDNVSVLLNNGDGTLAKAVHYGAGNGTHDIFAADLDGDGDADLATANDLSVYVSVLLNNGDGTFAWLVECGPAGMARGGLTADLDGDGDSDLATANWLLDNISVLLNNGDATFATAVNYEAGEGPVCVFAADLDGDGDLDLAAANRFSGEVSILMNLSHQPDTVLDVHFDIKPGSCPNPVNMKGKQGKGKAVLPAAILGTEDFDVTDVDPLTLSLMGVSPIRWSYEDVATPVSDPEDDCYCTSDGPDGYEDLALKFNRSEIIAALEQMQNGQSDNGRMLRQALTAGGGASEVTVNISGELTDGTAIEGHDCIRLLHKSGPMPMAMPQTASLGGNHPNPFNPSTNISFTLPAAGKVTLEVFNILGRRVAVLVNEMREAGDHTATWDAGDAASGVYFYRLQTADYVETRRMMYLK